MSISYDNNHYTTSASRHPTCCKGLCASLGNQNSWVRFWLGAPNIRPCAATKESLMNITHLFNFSKKTVKSLFKFFFNWSTRFQQWYKLWEKNKNRRESNLVQGSIGRFGRCKVIPPPKKDYWIRHEQWTDSAILDTMVLLYTRIPSNITLLTFEPQRECLFTHMMYSFFCLPSLINTVLLPVEKFKIKFGVR